MKAEHKKWAKTVAEDMMASFKPGGVKPHLDAKTGELSNASVKRGRNSVTTCAVLFDTGRILHVDNTACHAGLGAYSSSRIGAATPVAITNAVMNNQWLDKQDVISYLDWIANRSPFSSIFITKDAEKMIDEGMIVDTHHPANVVVGALILARGCSEYVSICYTFNRLVEQGVNENLACVMAHTFGCSKGGKELYLQQGHYSGHVLFDRKGVECKGYIDNFVKGNLGNFMEKYSKCKHYDNITDLVKHKYPGRNIKNEIVKFINDWIKNNGQKKEKKLGVENPFAKNIGRNVEDVGKTVAFDKGIVALAEYCKQEWPEVH